MPHSLTCLFLAKKVFSWEKVSKSQSLLLWLRIYCMYLIYSCIRECYFLDYFTKSIIKVSWFSAFLYKASRFYPFIDVAYYFSFIKLKVSTFVVYKVKKCLLKSGKVKCLYATKNRGRIDPWLYGDIRNLPGIKPKSSFSKNLADECA